MSRFSNGPWPGGEDQRDVEPHSEMEVAAGFLAQKLLNKYNGDTVAIRDAFIHTMSKRYNGHWHPEQPERGNAFRCVSVSDGRLDPVLRETATMAGILDHSALVEALPSDFTLWVDPGEVSVRVGDGAIWTLDRPSSDSEWNSSEEDSMPNMMHFSGKQVNSGLNPSSKVFTMRN